MTKLSILTKQNVFPSIIYFFGIIPVGILVFASSILLSAVIKERGISIFDISGILSDNLIFYGKAMQGITLFSGIIIFYFMSVFLCKKDESNQNIMSVHFRQSFLFYVSIFFIAIPVFNIFLERTLKLANYLYSIEDSFLVAFGIVTITAILTNAFTVYVSAMQRQRKG